MPDDFLKRYSARQIAEIMAFYRIKEQDRSAEQQRREIEGQRTRARRRR
jgi:hypothetical protein